MSHQHPALLSSPASYHQHNIPPHTIYIHIYQNRRFNHSQKLQTGGSGSYPLHLLDLTLPCRVFTVGALRANFPTDPALCRHSSCLQKLPYLPCNLRLLTDTPIHQPVCARLRPSATKHSHLNYRIIANSLHDASHIFHAPVARSDRLADSEPASSSFDHQDQSTFWQEQSR